jgi:hypothetical protein
MGGTVAAVTLGLPVWEGTDCPDCFDEVDADRLGLGLGQDAGMSKSRPERFSEGPLYCCTSCLIICLICSRTLSSISAMLRLIRVVCEDGDLGIEGTPGMGGGERDEDRAPGMAMGWDAEAAAACPLISLSTLPPLPSWAPRSTDAEREESGETARGSGVTKPSLSCCPDVGGNFQFEVTTVGLVGL